MKGFSRTNLLHMRAFASSYPDEQIVQQFVGQIPWEEDQERDLESALINHIRDF